MEHYNEHRGAHGMSGCGWWFPIRNIPGPHYYRGTYVVSLGTHSADDHDERWVANFGAVVDDFGNLRVVKRPWEAS
jgi:hypothetical protein